MTSDNWLALFMVGVVAVTIYGLLTAPKTTQEERESMEEELVGMKFDLHSNLAEQITIENLKWHYASIQADLAEEGYLTHEEDIRYYSGLLDHLGAVLDYFGEGE